MSEDLRVLEHNFFGRCKGVFRLLPKDGCCRARTRPGFPWVLDVPALIVSGKQSVS